MIRRRFLQFPLAVAVAASGAGAAGRKPQRLGLIADPQFADCDPAGSRHYRASLAKLEQAVEAFNAADLDAVITLGDFIDRDFTSFAPVMQRYKALRCPHFKVLGNHDFSVADALKSQVLTALGMKQAYSAHSLGGWRLVLLDGTDVSFFRPDQVAAAQAWSERMVGEGRKNAKAYNGGLGSTQFQWLEEQLEQATTTGQRVLLACHYPILPEDPHNLWNDREVIALIDRFPCVAAWFNGHHHRGNYAQRGHCHYVNFKGMVETVEHTAFAIVTLHEDRIEIDGFDTEPDRELAGPS